MLSVAACSLHLNLLLRTPQNQPPCQLVMPSPRTSMDVLALRAQNLFSPPVHCKSHCKISLSNPPSFPLIELSSPSLIEWMNIPFLILLHLPYSSFTAPHIYSHLTLYYPYPLRKGLIPILIALSLIYLPYPLFKCFPFTYWLRYPPMGYVTPFNIIFYF